MSVVVVGSSNVDLVSRVERIPSPGETVLSRSFATHPGGKGNNQVTAAARAGAEAVFVTAVGDDDNGRRLLGGLAADGVTVLSRTVDQPTGTAMISVADDGENAIVVNPGANGELRALTAAERKAVGEADVLLLQLEIPLRTVEAAAAAAASMQTLVVLNAAPVERLPASLLADVDVLVVNQHEAAILADADPDIEPRELAERLRELVGAVVVTLGEDGALIARAGQDTVHVASHRVTVVDTTGAGDSFCGALVAALDAAGGDLGQLERAARFATAAAALSVQRAGAVPSIPNRGEIDRVAR